MEYLLLLIIPLLGTLKVLIQGWVNRDSIKSLKDSLLYNGIVFFVIFVIATALFVRSWPSTLTIILGVVSGVLNVAFQVCYMQSFKYGPVSVSGAVSNFSCVIPLTAGFLFLGESFTVCKIIGLVLMVAALLLITLQKKQGDEGKVTLKWLLFISLAFFSAGGANVIQAIFKTTPCKEESNQLLAVTFLTAAVLCFLAAVCIPHKTEGFCKKSAIGGVMQGAVLGAYQVLVMYALVVVQISVSVYYPVTAALSVMLLTVLSAIIFKERLTLRQIVGIVLGTGAVVLLNIQ